MVVTQVIREQQRPTSEFGANRAGWEEKLQTFVNRSSAFGLPSGVGDDWLIEDTGFSSSAIDVRQVLRRRECRICVSNDR